MGRAEELRAELAMVELQDRLIALKADPATTPEALQACKVALREARQAFRELRAAAPPEVAAGDAVARPGTIQAGASVKRPGGGG